MKHNFIDAQEMAKLNPDTFEAPDAADLDSLKAGMHVKVCHNDERFWALITDIFDEDIIAEVDNVLVNEQPFSLGNRISFTKDNVYSIWECK